MGIYHRRVSWDADSLQHVKTPFVQKLGNIKGSVLHISKILLRQLPVSKTFIGIQELKWCCSAFDEYISRTERLRELRHTWLGMIYETERNQSSRKYVPVREVIHKKLELKSHPVSHLMPARNCRVRVGSWMGAGWINYLVLNGKRLLRASEKWMTLTWLQHSPWTRRRHHCEVLEDCRPPNWVDNILRTSQ